MNNAHSLTTLKRSFLAEADDLVDELLSRLKACGWTNLRMEYHLARLTATKSVTSDDTSAQTEVRLSASWEEEDEEIALTVTISSDNPVSDESKRKAATELVTTIFAREPYRIVVDPSNN